MKTFLKFFYLLPVAVVVGLVAHLLLNRSQTPPVRVVSGTPFASTSISNLTASFFTSERHLGPAVNDVFIVFSDANGKLVDVGKVSFELSLAGPAAILHQIFKVLPTSTPGQYRAAIQPQIVGDWQAKLIINGPSIHAEASFPLAVSEGASPADNLGQTNKPLSPR